MLNTQLTPGNKLKIYRMSKGWSQTDLGKRLGLSAGSSRAIISAHEKDQNGLKHKKDALALIFNTTPDTFINTSNLGDFLKENKSVAILPYLEKIKMFSKFEIACLKLILNEKM